MYISWLVHILEGCRQGGAPVTRRGWDCFDIVQMYLVLQAQHVIVADRSQFIGLLGESTFVAPTIKVQLHTSLRCNIQTSLRNISARNCVRCPLLAMLSFVMPTLGRNWGPRLLVTRNRTGVLATLLFPTWHFGCSWPKLVVGSRSELYTTPSLEESRSPDQRCRWVLSSTVVTPRYGNSLRVLRLLTLPFWFDTVSYLTDTAVIYTKYMYVLWSTCLWLVNGMLAVSRYDIIGHLVSSMSCIESTHNAG